MKFNIILVLIVSFITFGASADPYTDWLKGHVVSNLDKSRENINKGVESYNRGNELWRNGDLEGAKAAFLDAGNYGASAAQFGVNARDSARDLYADGFQDAFYWITAGQNLEYEGLNLMDHSRELARSIKFELCYAFEECD